MIDDDLYLCSGALLACRALLRARSEEEVVATVMDAVVELGGTLVPPTGGAAELPIDVTFGIGEPLVPAGDPEVLAGLRDMLPAVLEDARVALERTRREAHMAAAIDADVLTGLASADRAMRVLSRVRRGDAVVAVDLDDLRAVNETSGHDVGDSLLASFAEAVRSVCRAADAAGRIAGDEFLLVLFDPADGAPAGVVDRVAEAWQRVRVQPVTFSAGIAVVGDEEPSAALARAKAALEVAKGAGGGSVRVAP